MKFEPLEQEFRNPKVFHFDPKNIELDRVLVNLFLLLRNNGTRPSMRGKQKTSVEQMTGHLDRLSKLAGVKGFDEHREIAAAWLESDVFDLVNRGTDKEAVASLRPLHLDAHKIRAVKLCRDYNVSDALYGMLEYGSEGQVINDLHAYLGRGIDRNTQRYDGTGGLDLDTLTVIKFAEGVTTTYNSGEKQVKDPPTCIGQARILCDDVRRLLAYDQVIPRAVMIDYLKTVFGLHTALYILRLSRQLAGWLRDGTPHAKCLQCPVRGHAEVPFAECPYDQSFVVDMGSDWHARMARIAQESAALELSQINALIKSLFAINQLMQFARSVRDPDSPADAVRQLRRSDDRLAWHFDKMIDDIRKRTEGNDEQLPPEVAAILRSELPAFDRYTEMVTHVRQGFHLKHLVSMFDKLIQKNTEFGALTQGRSKGNPRRWQLGGRLLEVMVQLAVLRPTSDGRRPFEMQPLLVDEFLRWMDARYGFVIAPSRLANRRKPVTVAEHAAWRENVRNVKDRLREIGFYDDLSDAYNAQTLRARYRIDAAPEVTP